MAKILIISDSHGLKAELTEIKKRHAHEVDAMVHCGDSELDFHAGELEGFIRVAGNCDISPEFPEVDHTEAGEIPLMVTHGHLFGVKTQLQTLDDYASDKGYQIICYGHSHIARAEVIHNKLFINPGSIRLPRNNPNPTYAVLTVEGQEAAVHFYAVKGEEVESLQVKTTLG